MQMCLYKGNPIYSFDILGKNNIIIFDVEKRFRSASKQGLLKCSDCGDTVIFRFKDLEKRRPHFSHLNNGDIEGCSYGKETEEHIEGKRILLNRMRELYPDICHQMRYRIKSINRYTDLFFELDGQQLIIEFQRTDLDFEMYEEKIRSYNSVNINHIWLLSGTKEDLENITREYSLTFFQRINLNSTSKPILFLDVENRTITMMAKIVYEDKETNEISMDRMFSKTYPVDDLIIKLDGTFESDFEEYYNTERSNFIKDYEEKLELEKKRSIEKKLNDSINIEVYKKVVKREIKPELRSIYCKIYKTLVDDLLNNYTDNQFKIISIACNNNVTVHQIVNEILNEEIDKGNKEAKVILNKITEVINLP